MSAIVNILAKVDANQSEISNYGKFDQVVLDKINYKLRLDWNYYSNRIEGGTLTREETRSVMVKSIKINDKSLKEVTEMNGHDNIVVELLSIANNEKRISEKRIKEIHTAIMYEDDLVKKNEIGKWKTKANLIMNYNSEDYLFTLPENVATEIHTLLNSTNAELDAYYAGAENALHPVIIAAKFHIGYVGIHPFYDGNGRTARILTNLILIACGLPVIIIKDEHKNAYGKYLADIQAYGGSPDLFYGFIAARVIETQQIILDALEGKSIDEANDLDKKLRLLDQQLAAVENEKTIQQELTAEVVKTIFNTWAKELIIETIIGIQKFNKYFVGESRNHYLSIQNTAIQIRFLDENPTIIYDEFYNLLLDSIQKNDLSFHQLNFSFNVNYGAFKKGGTNSFGCASDLFNIKLERYKYEIRKIMFSEDNSLNEEKTHDKLLHETLTKEDITQLVTNSTDLILNHINFYVQKNGIVKK